MPGLAVLALIAYLLGVLALRRRGGRWPWHRTANFVTGIVTVLLAAGNIIWGFGEVPSIIAFAVVYFQWTRSEETRTKVSDRRVDADLEAYDARLRRLAQDSPRG